VVKHARATAVDIRFTLTEDGGGLVVEVTDNGTGPTAASGSPAPGGAPQDTLGLVSMRERTQRWGGQLAAGPRPAGGWTVQVTLPAPGPSESGTRGETSR
jgi:signal transduction histidine kinase